MVSEARRKEFAKKRKRVLTNRGSGGILIELSGAGAQRAASGFKKFEKSLEKYLTNGIGSAKISKLSEAGTLRAAGPEKVFKKLEKSA